MTDTVAPAMTAPVWSVTVPRIRPKLACANSAKENSNTPRIVPSSCVFNVTDCISVSFRTRKHYHLLGKGLQGQGSLTTTTAAHLKQVFGIPVLKKPRALEKHRTITHQGPLPGESWSPTGSIDLPCREVNKYF